MIKKSEIYVRVKIYIYLIEVPYTSNLLSFIWSTLKKKDFYYKKIYNLDDFGLLKFVRLFQNIISNNQSNMKIKKLEPVKDLYIILTRLKIPKNTMLILVFFNGLFAFNLWPY